MLRRLTTPSNALRSLPVFMMGDMLSRSFKNAALCEESSLHPVVFPTSVPSVVLYQYEPCPYCCKVKAVLDYLKVPYSIIEVNPLTKKETKFSEYNKVPIALINGTEINDSSTIIDTVTRFVNSSKTIE